MSNFTNQGRYPKQPRVSIIVPYFEANKWIPQTLESIKSQTFRNYEVVIVDDGSVNYPFIKERYSLPSNTIVVRQSNLGLAAARNTGIKCAHGQYIVCLDSDDLISPSYLEKCVQVLDNDVKLGFAYTGFVFFGTRNSHSRLQEYDLYLLLRDNYIISGAMFRKRAWQEVGGFYEPMRDGYEDWDFWISLGQSGWYGKLIPEYLFYYRQRLYSSYTKAFKRKTVVQQLIRERHPELYNPEKLVLIEKAWSEHRKLSVRVHYLMKRLFINDFLPTSLQNLIRDTYYLFRS